MTIEQHIVAVRRQFTGESLTGARRRLRELRDWSEPVPAARHGDQMRLESHLLQTLSMGSGRHPLGISEIVPFSERLVIRLESPELLTSVLQLLPYRDGRRSRHGVVDLRVTGGSRGIELTLGRDGDGRALLVGPRATCDLTSALAEHRALVETRRHVPLWTTDTPHDPPPRPLARRRVARSAKQPVPVRRGQVHLVSSTSLASAVLRRLHLWEHLNPDGTVQITSQPQTDGGGLAWTVEQHLPPGSELHDDIVTTVFADPVAGLGLTADAARHRCDQEHCVQSFDSGRLTVRTVTGKGTSAARQRSRCRADREILQEQTGIPAVREGPGGHVLQLVSSSANERDLMNAAEQLAAAWALQGALAVVLRGDGRTGKISWRRSRLTGGSGAMFTGTLDSLNDDSETEITRARAEFDHIILVERQWIDALEPAISPLADDHLVVADGHFPTTTQSTTAHAGKLQRHTIDLSPAESAMAWLHSRLPGFPYSHLPMTGLLLQRTPEEGDPDSFDRNVDSELARHGFPVLGRIPQTRGPSPRRTVLDHIPVDQRTFVMNQSAQIRERLGPARADGTAITAALSQMMAR